MKFSADRVNCFIATNGQEVDWRKADICPCRDQHSGAAKESCGSCGGIGYLWAEPVRGTVLTSGARYQKKWQDFGVYEEGDIVFTIPSDSPVYQCGSYDRLKLINQETPFSTFFTRGNNDVLRFSVKSISRIYWLDINDLVVEGGIPTVSETGVLSWEYGEPQNGAQYTITGQKVPEYFYYNDPFQFKSSIQGQLLPKKVVFRNFDLLSRSE